MTPTDSIQFPPRLAEDKTTTGDTRAAGALLADLPAVPPNPHAAQRVWRRMHGAPAPAWTPLRRWALAGAVAVIAVGVASMLRPGGASAHVLAVSGGVAVADVHATPGMAVALHQSVRAEASGRALVRVEGVAAVFVAPSSDASIEQMEHGTVIRLASGSVTSRVLKRPPQEPFLVEAGPYTVRVVGTLFTTSRAADGTVTVSVKQGGVDVLEQGRFVTRVTAGRQWSSSGLGMPPDATSHDLASLLEDALTAKGEALAARLDQLVAFVEPRIAPAPVPPPAAVLEHVARSEVRKKPEAARSDPFLLAQTLEAQGNYDAAADQYERAAAPSLPTTQMALYQLGRIAWMHLHDSNRAKAAFERYRREFPTADLAAEADFNLIEIAHETHNDADLLRETTHFLEAHPNAERAQDVLMIRATLRRTRSEWRGAIADYKNVTRPPHAEEAMMWLAYCQQQAGDSTGAIATYKEYLAQFPNGAHRADVKKALGEQ